MYSIRNQGITYRREGAPEKLEKGYLYDDLTIWADATWAECRKNSKSTTGYLLETKIGVVIAYCGKQNNVTNSSCESEVMANRSACQQGLYVRLLLADMGFDFSKPTVCMQDNQGAIAVCKSNAHHKRSRHFRVACHYLQELYLDQIITFQWVESKGMKADILTKALAEKQHEILEDKITKFRRR